MIYNTLHSKPKIEQHESHKKKRGKTQIGAPGE